MKRPQVTIEQALYLIAFIVALGIRLYNLGAAPLSDIEASWALQALDVARGEAGALGANPGYISLTGIFFFLLGSSNSIARFWPALAGSLLVWLPYLFRREEERIELEKIAGLIFAIGVALDPGLVALSRLAGGPMIALGFGLLAAGFFFRGRAVIAGLSLGIALLGGPAILQGALGLLLAWGFFRALPSSQEAETGFWPEVEGRSIRIVAFVAAGTALLLGTLFFRYPQGLSAIAAAFPEFLGTWVNPSGVPATRLFLALVIYQPLAVIFGLVGGVQAWRRNNSTLKWVSLWALASLLIALFNPGRQIADLAWTLIPWWILAAFALAGFVQTSVQDRLPALGHSALIFILLALAWINLAGIAGLDLALEVDRLRWLIVLGSLGLGVITTVLIVLGWSSGAAWRGLAWGSALALGLYILSNTWGVSQRRQTSEHELWRTGPAVLQVDQFMQTLGDLAEWRNGRRDTLDLVVAADVPSLRWALRGWNGAQFGSDLENQSLPAVIINRETQSSPSQTAAYRGQDFAWWVSPGWSGALPVDWTRWLVFRDAPEQIDHIILWARGDLFPDGTLALENNGGDEESLDGEVVPAAGEQGEGAEGPAE